MYEFECKEAVIIFNIEEFRKRIISYLDKNRGKNNIVSFEAHFVKYYDNDEKTKLLGPFSKTTGYWWQHEFRMIFKELPMDLEPLVLEIGDISDIAKKVSVKELIETPQMIFPKYDFVFEHIE